jgi:ABC-type uncharacterized transport system permease subunit
LVVVLYNATAALYLAAVVAAGVGLALGHVRSTRLSVAFLAIGTLAHGASFAFLHAADVTPPLTDTASVVSFMAWIGALGFLLLLWRARLTGLVVLVAPMAFLGVFLAATRLSLAGEAAPAESGSVPHAHVLLASAGLGLLGLAGLAGVLFLAEHRRLKRKLLFGGQATLPSLEALDQVSAVALAVGFSLLTLGVITGVMWVVGQQGSPWTGSLHEVLSLVAWAIYAVLVVLRFGARQGPRQCATSAVCGFVFLFVSVIGVEILA